RNEAAWLALVWAALVWLTVPASRATRLRLIGVPALVAIVVFAPWALRDWVVFGNPLPGLALANTPEGVKAAVVGLDFRSVVDAAGGRTLPVNGINRPRENDEVILFTPEFHRTTLTGPAGIEAIVIDGLVVSVHDGEGSQRIPDNGLVISAAGKAAAWVRENLRPGGRAEVRIEAAMHPRPGWEPDFVLGGGPALDRNGRPASSGDQGAYDQGFFLKRHPRTAAGVRADGTLVLVTVDGRRPAQSVGMTIAELEGLMIELGSVEAVNLDGGGSTTMVIRGKAVNSPSDPTGERPVSDALLVFLRQPAPRAD
ncbi:MAG: phosphodiester glycosidase family protein, partial [Candidatus Aminicenantales bacterium]